MSGPVMQAASDIRNEFKRLCEHAVIHGLEVPTLVPHPFKAGSVCCHLNNNRFSGRDLSETLLLARTYLNGYGDGKNGGCGRA